MDQKSENRKRFQDKQRLKRSHQTPSDRKYRKEQLQAAPIPEKKPLPSNHERYVEIEQVQEDITDLTQLSKTKLKENTTQPSTSNSKNYTAKQLQQMDVDELNRLLQPTPNNTNTNTTNNNTHTSNAASSDTTNNASSTPLELHDDEDFLDSLL